MVEPYKDSMEWPGDRKTMGAGGKSGISDVD